MDLVERAVPITEPRPAASRAARYRLADPYLIFWHRFVTPLAQSGRTITAAPEALFRARVEPRLSEHMGLMFERACRAFVARARDLPIEAAEVGSWWRGDHEIDVVARSLDGREVLLGECTWGEVDEHDRARLERAAAAFRAAAPDVERAHLVLFCGGQSRAAGPVEVITAEDLFTRLPPGSTPPLP
jgi:hypothetical protein